MAEQTAERQAPPPPPSAPRRRRLALPERIPVRGTILVILSIAIVLGVTLGTASTLRTARFTGANWIDLFINGVARGSVYALIALGYTLVYGILFMINFAHGEVFMAGAFTALFAAFALAEHGVLNTNPILSIGILFVVSMITSMTVGIVLERVAYRPLRGAPRLVPLITAIGASLFLQYTFRGLYGAQAKGYPIPSALDGSWTIFGIPFLRTQFVVILSAIVLMISLYLFIARTRTGRSMRAVGEDKEIASLMGINVDRTIVTTFAIGGMLAGAAGILEAVGPILFLSGAGVPSPNQLQPVVAFGILVLVLIFRPGGIFGSPEEKRA